MHGIIMHHLSHPHRCQPFSVAPVAPRVAMPVAQAAPQEVAQLAIDAGFIWGTAGICFAMTLVVWIENTQLPGGGARGCFNSV